VLHKYHENDYLCYVRVVTDADEEVLEHNDYSGFGQRLESSTGSTNRYRYNGKEEQATFGTPYSDYGARQYSSASGRWLTVDPLTEKYYSYSPYAFCNNNPVNFVDPDGKSWYDTVIGYAIGATTNIVPGTSRLRDSYSPDDASDYNSALRTADNTAEAVGEFITVAGVIGTTVGATMTFSGTGAAVSSAGTLAVVAVPVAVAGMKVTAVGMTAAASGMMMMSNSAANKSGGYERGKSNVSSGNKNSKHANQKAKAAAEQKYKDAKVKYEELSRRSNKTKEDVKLKEKFRREYEHWKKKMDFSGENHSQKGKN
jgi:RHS repeat-associated protein